jgi:hypothetical protein
MIKKVLKLFPLQKILLSNVKVTLRKGYQIVNAKPIAFKNLLRLRIAKPTMFNDNPTALND